MLNENYRVRGGALLFELYIAPIQVGRGSANLQARLRRNATQGERLNG